MLEQLPGVFCTDEMPDWEAPIGSYLLTACLASGRRAGEGAVSHSRHICMTVLDTFSGNELLET